MSDQENPQINPGVTGAPWAKQQVGIPSLCLLVNHRDGTPFNIGQKCGQCSTYTSGQHEVHAKVDPDHSCLCLSTEQIERLNSGKIITVIWDDRKPTSGSVRLPDSSPPTVSP